jgi:hypothetical protein
MHAVTWARTEKTEAELGLAELLPKKEIFSIETLTAFAWYIMQYAERNATTTYNMGLDK